MQLPFQACKPWIQDKPYVTGVVIHPPITHILLSGHVSRPHRPSIGAFTSQLQDDIHDGRPLVIPPAYATYTPVEYRWRNTGRGGTWTLSTLQSSTGDRGMIAL